MAEDCVCGGSLGQTGIDGCVITFKTTHNYSVIPTYKADGTRNYIDLTTGTVGADILALTQVTTPALERLYPLPYAEEVDRTKSEEVTQTPASGNVYPVRDGLRNNKMKFMGKNASFGFAKELEKFGCTDMSYFAHDVNGTMEGYIEDGDLTKFYPIPMMDNSLYTMYEYATDTTIQMLNLSFNMKRDFKETQNHYLTSTDLGYPSTDLVGLVPCTMTVVAGSITATGVTVEILRPSMSALATVPLTGLLAAAFTVTDVTGSANVPVLSSTESTDGNYDLTWADVPGSNEFLVEAVSTGRSIESVTFTDPS